MNRVAQGQEIYSKEEEERLASRLDFGIFVHGDAEATLAHWTSRGSYHLQPKEACRRVFVLQIAKTTSTSEVESYKRCDQIRFEYRCTVYKLVKTLHWIHLHCIIID